MDFLVWTFQTHYKLLFHAGIERRFLDHLFCSLVTIPTCQPEFKSSSYPITFLDRPLGAQEFKAPRMSRKSAH
jgi:hypothetical protein